MELKWEKFAKSVKDKQVLIVPLWNWNQGTCTRPLEVETVLIVPLWNWNSWLMIVVSTETSFNRTFMELKFSGASTVQRTAGF